MLLAGGAAAVMLGGTVAANALWGASSGTTVAEHSLGGVTFAAAPSDGSVTPQVSASGEAVSVTVPGTVVIKVMDDVSANPDPVIWRFTAKGAALGIAGLDYTLAASEQIGQSGSHSLADGVAKPGTVLEQSTMKVYPAGIGSDCSAIPETPAPVPGEAIKNVFLFEAEGATLQRPGEAVTGLESEREWCVAISWNSEGDGVYMNDVQVTSTGQDGTPSGAMDGWHGVVGFPPALDMLGSYENHASVQATGADSTTARAETEWFVDLYPDPAGEPGVVITLAPTVTNLNPDFAPSA